MDLAPVPTLAYAGQVCFSCYRAPPQTEELRRCGGCRRVKFCSAECSKKEWKDHKPFCLSFSTLRQRPHAYLPPLSSNSPSALSARRETHRSQFLLEDELLTAALGRDQTVLEGQLLWREPRCRECGDREGEVETREGAGEKEGEAKGWRFCGGCKVVQWCCGEHEKLGSEGHREVKGADGRSQCETLQLSTEIDEFHLRHSLSQAHLASPSPPSLWIPTRRLSSPTHLPSSGGWEAYLADPLVARSLPTSPPPTKAQIYGIWLEALSPPISFLAALRRIPSSNIDISKTLTLHLLEETHQSLSAWLPALEELGHQLPSLRSMEIRACAPTTTSSGGGKGVPLPLCPECKAEGKERRVVSCGGVSAEGKAGGAQAAVVWNRSFAQADPDSPFWADQLRALLSPSSPSTPLIWFSLTAEESSDELDAVLSFARSSLPGGEEGVEVLWRPERNEWSGGWPRVDLWEEDGVVRRGEWSWAVRRRE
ncbi:hypothetical protein BCR35DRAFT_304642 [Leucosporidium creatinivorum]|uniref:MYND-type domain-containing protein n=1 Tax=Leucosporidium creatinivorum TaxID=106004 RepID=A0A1Y2FAA8_9BASI|nr:hypothetical protein BCR35DRAFT_304642 [Leucosporidium creatinivorum]